MNPPRWPEGEAATEISGMKLRDFRFLVEIIAVAVAGFICGHSIASHEGDARYLEAIQDHNRILRRQILQVRTILHHGQDEPNIDVTGLNRFYKLPQPYPRNASKLAE